MDKLTLDLGGVINTAIDEKLKEFDVEGQIKELLGDVASKASKVLTIKLDGEDGGGKRFPLVHNQFEDLLSVVAMGETTLITGGAGLSKSTAVEQCAEALNLDFVPMSFSNQTTKTDLFGFVDANGIYQMSGFVDAFMNGKLFLGDEMDACSANVFVLLNSAIENGFLLTPENHVLHSHKNFRFVGTANTNLRGAKDGFTARNKLDAATIDRFVVIEWKLDLELEEKITSNDGWLKIVRKCRKIAEEQLDGVTITPRPAYKGAKLLKAGIDIDKVIEWTLIKALGTDERDVLLKKITSNDKASAVKDAGGKLTPKVEVETEVETIEVDEAYMDEIEVDDVKQFGQW